jgi:ketosteroid isomerase-like protein
MNRDEMHRLFQQHRKAEAARDYDAIMTTVVEDCYLETVPLELRIEGRTAARAAYEGYFTAFPDLSPDDEAFAFGDDVIVTWGTLRRNKQGSLVWSSRDWACLCVEVRECRALPGRADGRRKHPL